MIRPFHVLLSLCLFIGVNQSCLADSDGLFKIITPSSRSTVWLNPGLGSYHFDQSQDFNAANYGFGGEYQFSSVASITAGTFRNSNYHQSNYIGMYWQPIAIGPVMIGFVAGGFNGYSSNNHGGWFPAVLPAFTIEGDWIGLNLLVIPTIGERVSGSLSFQVKFKVFE